MNPDELLKAPKGPGLYFFRNKINGKYYVGQAEQLRKRLRHHVSNVKYGRYDNPIYCAIKKYDWENFEWGILETYDENIDISIIKQKLDEGETKYIKQFNSYGATGYNQTLGGDGGITGYKFTPDQLKYQRDNAKKRVINRDECKIYFYDIETKEYGEWISWLDFRKEHNIKSNHLDIILHGNRYIVGRTKEQLEYKINSYNSDENSNHSLKTNLSEDKIQDIKNGMKWKEYCEKYSVCRKTYFIHKNIVFSNHQRVYNTKIDLALYEKYREIHTRKETAEYFNILEDLTYDYDKRIQERGNSNIVTKDTTSSSITDEMRNDILNGISNKEYCEKYNVSESLCSTHKRIVRLNDSIN